MRVEVPATVEASGTDPVRIELSQDEALVLYEFLTRGEEADDQYGTIDDQAELRVLWDLQAVLESVLEQPLMAEYRQLLEAARDRVRDPPEYDLSGPHPAPSPADFVDDVGQ